MKKRRILTVVASLLVGMTACSNSSDHATSNQNQSKQENPQESSDQNNSSQTDDTQEQDNHVDEETSSDTTSETNEKETIQEDTTTNTLSNLEGRKTEFLEKLDTIQKELDALPEKKDADNGVTNAMKNYYGISYEKYDKSLNEIYAFLQKELPKETMENLHTKQLKWIEKKEAMANEERKKYNGGTFENVAYYISLYESTKQRCYKLVNEYMDG